MRRFLVASCCVIVALQVLIGVPLAVCIGFFSLVEVGSVEVQSGNQFSAMPPPLPYSAVPSPVGYAPAANYCAPASNNFTPPAMAPSMTSPPGWIPTALPPVAATSPSPAPDAIPTTPGLEPIVESRAEQGSPLAESSLAAASPAEEARAFVAALEHVAATEPASPPADAAHDAEATASALPPCQDLAGKPDQAGQPAALVAALRTSVEHLYPLAQSLETDGCYDRADQLRDLARKIREEIDTINRDLLPPPPPPLAEPQAVPTVTEASYDPAPAAISAPAVAPPPVPAEPYPRVPSPADQPPRF
jgi:hypothetical protein